jgi:hypothetical protein
MFLLNINKLPLIQISCLKKVLSNIIGMEGVEKLPNNLVIVLTVEVLDVVGNGVNHRRFIFGEVQVQELIMLMMQEEIGVIHHTKKIFAKHDKIVDIKQVVQLIALVIEFVDISFYLIFKTVLLLVSTEFIRK